MKALHFYFWAFFVGFLTLVGEGFGQLATLAQTFLNLWARTSKAVFRAADNAHRRKRAARVARADGRIGKAKQRLENELKELTKQVNTASIDRRALNQKIKKYKLPVGMKQDRKGLLPEPKPVKKKKAKMLLDSKKKADTKKGGKKAKPGAEQIAKMKSMMAAQSAKTGSTKAEGWGASPEAAGRARANEARNKASADPLAGLI